MNNMIQKTEDVSHSISNPVISVIIPVYNTKKYLARCVDSVLAQTYSDLEVILVDDCSTDGSGKLIGQYAAADERVKAVRHEKNMGLFQARLTGYTHATGKYIAFVDSDDYVSVDWFRMLLRRAESTSADITVGEWCFDFNGAHRDYCNLDHFRLMDYDLKGKQVMDAFMAVQGRNFSWTVVWNKLYTRKLWNKCFPMLDCFSREHGHMIMWEDIAFSSALWAGAKKATNVHGAYYFYFKHDGASTHNTANRARNNKYIRDASAAIWFMKTVLERTGLYKTHEEDFAQWKIWGMRGVYRDLVVDLNQKAYKGAVLEAFRCDAEDYKRPDDFFYSITTPLNASFDWLEDVKKTIISEQILYVSFDVFDTLVQRPFFYPTDLFQLLSEKFNEGTKSYVNFKYIRQSVEQEVRQEMTLYHPSKEDITLDEIYGYMQKRYVFAPGKLEQIKQYEIELELRFCKIRKSGKELFELALESGKRIIICSDMYLPKGVIEEILSANGYAGYEKLYLSCELGATKDKKTLFQFVQKDLKCRDTSRIMHIGDNWTSDVENPRACGWRTFHLSKSTDMIMNGNPGIYSGEAFHKLYRNAFFKEDYRLSFNDFTSVRCVTALAANWCFDSPYVSVNPWSDFNADPRVIGYTAFGPHLLALCQWIHENVERRHIGTVHFVARDGYLVKQAYDILYPDTSTNYLRLSRKALVLADVETAKDIYSLFNKIKSTASPKEFSKLLNPIIPGEKLEELPELFRKEGYKFNRPLKNQTEREGCMKIFIENVLDMDLLPGYKAALKDYFLEIIQPGDFLFDVGYSGRPESALSSILGFPVGSLYIHVNGEIAAIRQEKFDCPTETFYQFKPCITGTIREHLLMELGPSTVGYEMVNGKMEPALEPYTEVYCSEFITKIVQDYALRFVQNYNEMFHGFRMPFSFQREVISAPFEYYLHNSKPVDRQMFSAVPFEDDMGVDGDVNVLDFWNRELATRNLGTAMSGGNVSNIAGDVIPGLYVDGYLIKFVQLINKIFPRGGRSRELLKKIISFFVK